MKKKTTKILCKKSISFLLALLLVLTAIPLGGLSAFAATSGDFAYEVLSEEDKTCEITQYTGLATDLNIPVQLDGYTVTSIAGWAFSGSSLTGITVPNSVLEINDYAFSSCTFLSEILVATDNPNYSSKDGVLLDQAQSVLVKYPVGKTTDTYTVPDSVMTIHAGAFRDCAFLTNIYIPAGVQNIEVEAFYNCTALVNISVAADNPFYCSADGILFDKAQRELIQYPASKTATAYTIPDSVTSIGYAAFDGCAALETVHIPDSVVNIGYCAFGDCTALKNVTIPTSVTNIADSAFSNCTSLTEIIIPDGVISIGRYAFEYCTSLHNIIISDNVANIGWYAFNNTAYYNTESNWENGILYIGNHLIEATDTFSGAYTVKQGTKTIAVSAFAWCNGLTSIVLPDSIRHIGDSAFDSCSALTEIVFLGDAEYISIGDCAFSATAVTEIELPANTYFESWMGDIPAIYVPFGSLAWRCALVHSPEAICYSDSVSYSSELNLPTETDFDLYSYPNDVQSWTDFCFEQTAVLQFTANYGTLHFEIENIFSTYGAHIYLYNPQDKSVQEPVFAWCTSFAVGGDDFAKEESVQYTAVGDLSGLTVDNTYYLAVICGDADGSKGKIRLGSYLDFADKSYTLTENVPLEICPQEKDTTYALAFTPTADDIYYLDGGAQEVLDADGGQVEAQLFGYALTAGKTYYFIVSHGVGQTGVYILRRPQTENGFTYVSSSCDGYSVITSYEGTSQTVIVPEQLGGYPVMWLYSDSFKHNPYIQSIVIPSNIYYIGSVYYEDNIFADCPNLKIIYGYTGSFAEIFANRYGYTFIPLTVDEPENGVSVEFSPENPPAVPTALQVTKIGTTDEQQTYDITLTANGNSVQPAAPVTVKIPVPDTMNGADCKVYRQEADGTYTDMQAIYQDGYMVFTTDHFSIYMLTTKDPNAPAITMGDVNNDGKVNAVDARWILQTASGERTLPEEQNAAADVNGDGKINAVDARWILQVTSGERVL